MPAITFHFFYNDSTGVGVASLAPTVNIYRIPLAGGAGTLVVPGAAAVEDVGAGLGGGFYHYRHADDGGGVIPDLATYNYTAKAMVVVATVQAKQIPALWVDYSAHVTGLWTVLFAGITVLGNWLRGLYRKDAMNAAAKLEVNIGGGTYDEADHSNQAIADAIPVIPATVTVSDITQAALAKFANTDTLEVAAVPGSVAELSQCNAAGFPAGAISFEYIEYDSGTGLPVDNVAVWISTDNPADGNPTNVIWSGMTDAFGVARDVLGNKPLLDPGTYFMWRSRPGYSTTNPDTNVVS